LFDDKRARVALDANTRQILILTLMASADEFDAITARVVIPALDDGLRRELSRLHAWLRTRRPSELPYKTWRGRGVYLHLEEFQNPLRWEVSFGYLEKKKPQQ
jgi:hypothetical protein